jgi:hypothetical protein
MTSLAHTHRNAPNRFRWTIDLDKNKDNRVSQCRVGFELVDLLTHRVRQYRFKYKTLSMRDECCTQ